MSDTFLPSRKGICLINYPKDLPRSHADEQAERIEKYFPDWLPVLFFYEGKTVVAEFISCCDDLEPLNVVAEPVVSLALPVPVKKRKYTKRKPKE